MPTPWGCCCDDCKVCFAACVDFYFGSQAFLLATQHLEVWTGTDTSGTKVADQTTLACITITSSTTYHYRYTVTTKKCDGSDADPTVVEGDFTTPETCHPVVVHIPGTFRRRLRVNIFYECRNSRLVMSGGGGLANAVVTMSGDVSGSVTTDAYGIACFDLPADLPDSPSIHFVVSHDRFTTLEFDFPSFYTTASCEEIKVRASLLLDNDHTCDCLDSLSPPCDVPPPITLHGSDRNNGDIPFVFAPLAGPLVWPPLTGWTGAFNGWVGAYSYYEPEAGHYVYHPPLFAGPYLCTEVSPATVPMQYVLNQECITVGGVPKIRLWVQLIFFMVQGTTTIPYTSCPCDVSPPRLAAANIGGSPACPTGPCTGSGPVLLGEFACGEPISGTATFAWGPNCPAELPSSLTISE